MASREADRGVFVSTVAPIATSVLQRVKGGRCAAVRVCMTSCPEGKAQGAEQGRAEQGEDIMFGKET